VSLLVLKSDTKVTPKQKIAKFEKNWLWKIGKNREKC